MIQTYLKFDAERAAVLAELTDLASWPDWWPGVRRVTVLEEHHDRQVVELDLSLVVTITLVLEIDRSQPDCIRFRQLRGWFRSYEGEWRVLPSADDGTTTLRLTAALVPPGLVPRSIVYSRLLRTLELLEERLSRRLQRARAEAAPAEAAEGAEAPGSEAAPFPDEPRVQAHVFRTSRGLEVWIRGHRYRLRRAPESATPASPRVT